MRILLVNDYGTPTGGAEIGAINLRNHLRALGHEARLFASTARPMPVPSAADDECFGTTSRWRTLLQTFNPWAYAALKRVLAGFRPDVVHVDLFLTQLSPLILPLLRDIPSVYYVHWYRPICPTGIKRLPSGQACSVPLGTVCQRSGCVRLHDWPLLMLQMRLWRQWQSVFDSIVANSHTVQQRLAAEGVPAANVILPGMPPSAYRPMPSGTPTAVFAGRLVREKGAHILVEAFAQVAADIPTARLRLVGYGSEHDNLLAQINRLGLQGSVTLHGYVPPVEREALFADAWVQVVPSLWAEPFGRVALEAMMQSTAVIASRAGGLAELIEEGQTGLLVPPGDVAALANALRVVLSTRQTAEAMGRAGHFLASENFTTEANTSALLKVYDSIRG